MKQLLIALGASLIAALPVANVAAQPPAGRGIVLTPLIQKLNLGSGLQTATSTVTLENTTPSPVEVRVSFRDVLPLGPNGSIIKNPGTGFFANSTLTHWMHVSGPSLLVLAPNEQQHITISIDNASDLRPGGHYAAAAFATAELGSASTAHASFSQEIDSLYFVNKLQGAQTGMQLSSVTPNSTHKLPSSVDLKFTNTGDTFVVPRGYITVTDSHDTLLANGQINANSALIPQASSRNFTAPLQSLVASAKGRLKLTVFYRYDGQAAFQSQTVFISSRDIVRPVVVVIAVLLALVALGCFRKYRSKRAY